MNTYMPPHKGSSEPVHHAGNAALLIDFDNVTMGIRSDLTKELKNLLNSDIIKGKVAVQRAYADWRRYPQYIVPLSEGSVDLIFAPAYGSSKKNATDIRLAIDALELVFTRPEIGTFILLSGDSDFSSLVLKLKEYGKYVIGVGIKESSSDLLVQNCDEYYSYNALTGLQRAGEEDAGSRMDPWELVQAAVERMAENDDVMRSDRLKQVMIEMDDSFDEKAIGYSKYNRFLSEASSKGRIKLRKLENGQYEVAPAEGRRRAPSRPAGAPAAGTSRASVPTVGGPAAAGGVTLDASYDLLRRAVRDLAGSAGGAVRDSDVKRRMLELRSDWDEATVGFGKFSHFLRQAHNSEVIDLQRTADGLYEVVLPSASARVEEEDEEVSDTSSARMAHGARSARPEREPRGGNGRRGRGRGRGRDRAQEELPPSEPHLSGDEATGSRPVAEERASAEAQPERPRTREPRPTRQERTAREERPAREEQAPAAAASATA
ncbi:MAG TPA: NYN domain-containing protein, partial [Longimicrobiales bacterium]|nr:NYN domain-containing protein [Longimicrobiales bacterium]